MSRGSAGLEKQPGSLTSVRVFFLTLAVLAAAGLPRLFAQGQFSGNFLDTYSLQWVILLAINSLLALAGWAVLMSLFTRLADRVLTSGQVVITRLAALRLGNLVGFLIPWLAFVLIVLWRYEKHYAHFLPRLWIFWLMVGIGAIFLMALWKKPLSFFTAMLATAVLYGAVVKAIGFFPEISAYPFSLSWSEASRYYYASLPYAGRLYGLEIPLSSLHPTRYLLLGLPFLFDHNSIWLHRFWQVGLWVGLSLLTGWSLARRFKLGWGATLLVAVWGYLFMLQGPVYYHLLVCVLLVFWGFDRQRFWKSFVVILIASAWAGISRVNWIPVPAMLAIALYLIERPVCDARSLPAYLWQPAAWGVGGVLAALGSQAAYVLVSGHEDVSVFGSSFTSDLLWYRLLPSPTYSLGVLPAILLVSAPLLVLIAGNWLGGKQQWHWLRLLGLAGMLAAVFAVGLVVSTKIGGGSNIHNLDAFLALLMAVGVPLALGRFATETGQPAVLWRPWPLLLMIALAPVIWNLDIGDPFVRRNFDQANFDLEKLSNEVRSYATQGEVLFITQRQMVVFDLVSGQQMSPDYELMTLSEMAISNNRPYLEQFEADLRNHRFALIVSDQQQTFLKDPSRDAFAEEHNAWVNHISRPLLKYYQSVLFFDTQGVDLMTPQP